MQIRSSVYIRLWGTRAFIEPLRSTVQERVTLSIRARVQHETWDVTAVTMRMFNQGLSLLNVTEVGL